VTQPIDSEQVVRNSHANSHAEHQAPQLLENAQERCNDGAQSMQLINL